MLVEEKLVCYHCGQPCIDDTIRDNGKTFCCFGCKVIYTVINDSSLCEYYSIEKHPGIKGEAIANDRFSYLDHAEIRKQLLEFDSREFARMRFQVPAIHCVSCIWLLENLHKANPGVLRTEVNFTSKTVLVDFNPQAISLGELANLLSSLGYAPRIDAGPPQAVRPHQTSLVAKLALAGFAFGNVMLFSFPEYLGLDGADRALQGVFSGISIFLSIPVLLFSGSDYLTSAWKSFKQKQINIDVPIAIGLLGLFSRSVYDILQGTGPGYLDSFTGLVFFLLIGRWFQGKTYETLSFERDFKSYFPLAVLSRQAGEWRPVPIQELKQGDTLKVRSREIVPADSRLDTGETFIDYSFVTGEEKPARVRAGEFIYAGGRVIGQPVTLTVEKTTSQSYLTTLWNHETFQKSKEGRYMRIIDASARAFTWAVIGIALVTGAYWYFTAPENIWLVLTSVLVVACPCALALAAPFTYGSMLRVFGRRQFYLKNADVIERLAFIDAVVFDKTGTVTHGRHPEVQFHGELGDLDRRAVKSLTSSSTHPLSQFISDYLKEPAGVLESFREFPGKGLEGTQFGITYKIGSAAFANTAGVIGGGNSKVYVSADGELKGYFTIAADVRPGVQELLSRLGVEELALISGDSDADRDRMRGIFGPGAMLLFNQDPHQKLAFVKSLQEKGRKVLMIGDGLNDAGALRQSDVGIAVTEDAGVFVPSCDAILHGDQVKNLDVFVRMARSARGVLKIAFAVSFVYNAVSLAFAVSGNLTPLVAAVLMPMSSISVVSLATLGIKWTTSRIDKKFSL